MLLIKVFEKYLNLSTFAQFFIKKNGQTNKANDLQFEMEVVFKDRGSICLGLRDPHNKEIYGQDL